jgi:XTP/dITP diphosphohydrolase
MRIILASSNRGKIAEFKDYLDGYEVLSFGEVTEPFEIEESGESFKENAIIKSRAVFERLKDENAVVLSDDSGISVPILGGIPGIYSARFAGKDASAKDNLELLVKILKEKDIQTTPAFYTASIAISTIRGDFSVHGWMYGRVVSNPKGNNGFGYDPMFVPDGFDKTLGELDADVKKMFSHRAQALTLAKILLKTLVKEKR